MSLKFLLDENISSRTAEFLGSIGFDAISARSLGLSGADDAAIAARALQERRTLITFDLDFGELFFTNAETGSVIVLRLEDQTVESVNDVLGRLLLSDFATADFSHTLIIVEDRRIRIRKRK